MHYMYKLPQNEQLQSNEIATKIYIRYERFYTKQ